MYEYPCQAADKRKLMVIGSNRADQSDEADFAKKMWGEEHTLLTYGDDPNTVTLDIRPAVNPGKHIIGDAARIDPSTLGTVITLYLERPWTYDNNMIQTDTMVAIQTNTVAQYIHNLLPILSRGGKVIIEWHPFISRMRCYTGKETQFVEDPVILSFKNANPFTGFFDRYLSLAATCLALNKDISEHYHESFIAEARKIVPTIQKYINFYVSQGFSRNNIIKKLILETEILRLVYQSSNNIEYIRMPVYPWEELTLFNAKVDHIGLVNGDGTTEYVKLVEKNKSVKQADNYKTILKNTIGTGTIYYFLWSDIAVETNKDAAIECLKTFSLTDITLTRGTSCYNNRKNVHLLSGVKP